MSKILVPNRLGWVKSVELDWSRDMIDVSSYGDYGRFIPGNSSLELNLSIQAVPTPALEQLVNSWMYDGIYMPTFQREFMCLWCGSPNSIEHTHCSRCGAPRSFVVGWQSERTETRIQSPRQSCTRI